ncbi:MAG: two-component system sensor histidine kinase NtrB, partial [Candidatus Puniceispirillales bacterium]
AMDDFFDPPVISLLGRARQNGSSVHDQGVEIRSQKLGRKLINIQISPLLDQPEALVVAIQERSLAEKLRGQEQFRGAARSMGHIAALLSHEIKNPLAGIRGAAELIAADPGGDSTALTDLITAEADRIAALLTRAETLAGGKPPERRPVNINEILHHSIALAESSFGKKRQFVHGFDPSLPMASGDRDLLTQCFINLIKNACEATDNDGVISIKTSFNLGARLALGGDQDRAASPLLVEIGDNGSGIPDHLHAHVFDPFVTGKSTGSGLGLAMVASTVASHDGTIDFESRPGQTRFRVGLPMVESGT